MAKLSAWIVTIIGILLVLPLIGVALPATLNNWLIALGVLIMGIGKLMRSYKKRK